MIEPLIRIESTGSTDVTWGEFVEAGLLREYRIRRLPIERLRPLISALRSELRTPYPLALARPLYSSGRELLWRYQRDHNTAEELFLVVRGPREGGYQLALTEIARQFVSRIEFEPPEVGVAARWFPLGPDSKRIALDPRIAFGLPTINGIRTEAIAELRAAGEQVARIASTFSEFGLRVSDVHEAVKFEKSLARAA